ncbi:MAG: hypothetical protein GF344_17230 [Chitinivibrionales bacterium]|nr:hypothetical protein [Chitinivibrionales bacterium]MBD3358414.1 hypothetical protein [Chitinivibrionales bacterium]
METLHKTAFVLLSATVLWAESTLDLEARVFIEELPHLTRAVVELDLLPIGVTENPTPLEIAVKPRAGLLVENVVVFLHEGAKEFQDAQLLRKGENIRARAIFPTDSLNRDTAQATLITIVFDTDTVVKVDRLDDIISSLRVTHEPAMPEAKVTQSLTARFEGTKPVSERDSRAKEAQIAHKKKGSRHTLRFYLPHKMHVSAFVTDAEGAIVEQLLDTKVGTGVHAVSWTPTDTSKELIAQNHLFIQIEAGSTIFSARIDRQSKDSRPLNRHSNYEKGLEARELNERGLAAAVGGVPAVK